jgi:hypothetical protein
VQKEQQQQKKLLQQKQKQEQQTVMSGAAFLLDSSPSPAPPAIAEAPAAAPAPPAPAAALVSESQSPPAVAAPASSSLSPLLVIGQPVRLVALSTEWLNGAEGTIASQLDPATGRYLVKVHAPKETAVKCNVTSPRVTLPPLPLLTSPPPPPCPLQGEAKLRPENLLPLPRAANVVPVSDYHPARARVACMLVVYTS